uniref:Uncharacterized protein n=1 Tax=Oryza brachyantha TaxID=4533 RepID=J3LGW2_ORYBR
MAMVTRFVLPLMVAVLLLSSAVSGSARPLAGGDKRTGVATSSDHPLIHFIQHLYLQQLGHQPGHSCKTHDPNNPPCHN